MQCPRTQCSSGTPSLSSTTPPSARGGAARLSRGRATVRRVHCLLLVAIVVALVALDPPSHALLAAHLPGHRSTAEARPAPVRTHNAHSQTRGPDLPPQPVAMGPPPRRHWSAAGLRDAPPAPGRADGQAAAGVSATRGALGLVFLWMAVGLGALWHRRGALQWAAVAMADDEEEEAWPTSAPNDRDDDYNRYGARGFDMAEGQGQGFEGFDVAQGQGFEGFDVAQGQGFESFDVAQGQGFEGFDVAQGQGFEGFDVAQGQGQGQGFESFDVAQGQGQGQGADEVASGSQGGSPTVSSTGGQETRTGRSDGAGASARQWLRVPYEEKDEAKALGARWDIDRRLWYAPNAEPALTRRWGMEGDGAPATDRGPADAAPAAALDVRWLHVPYDDKEAAKALGARWDKAKRLWYAPRAEPELVGRWGDEAVHWLEVPFEAKDEAKRLGAQWHPVQKKWYVRKLEPERWSPALLQRWGAAADAPEDAAGAGEDVAGAGEDVAGGGQDVADGGQDVAGAGQDVAGAGQEAPGDTAIHWLDVPYADREDAKGMGARWDPTAKRWYAPSAEPALVERWGRGIAELAGEDPAFGGAELYVDLVPSSCWFTNARSCVSPGDWERVRRFVLDRAAHRCECCGAAPTPRRNPLEVHERWQYTRDPNVQRLVRLIALCKACHAATHLGLAQVRGGDEAAREHLARVRGASAEEVQRHVEEAFALWEERSAEEWELDLSVLRDNGIEVVQPGTEGRRDAAEAGLDVGGPGVAE